MGSGKLETLFRYLIVHCHMCMYMYICSSMSIQDTYTCNSYLIVIGVHEMHGSNAPQLLLDNYFVGS